MTLFKKVRVGYPTSCYKESCQIKFTIKAEDLRRLAKLPSGKDQREAFVCPCGHPQVFNDKGAVCAIIWLGNNYPELLDDGQVVVTQAQVVDDSEKKVADKIKEIDDYLFRRGKFAEVSK